MISAKKEVLKKKFGATIQQIREKKGLTLRQVSANCSLDNSKISKIEDGRFNVALSTIIELARGLEEHPSRLLQGDYDWMERR